MTKQELLETIQNEYELKLIETTTGTNGYPQCLKKALIGFENFDEVKEILKQHPEFRATAFHKRDGWQLWERNNNDTYEPFQNSASDYGDNYGQFTKENVENYFENEVKPCLNDFENFEDLNKFLKDREEVYNQLLFIDDDEILITCQGSFFETIKKFSMDFYHDTHSYAIGIIID